MDQDSYQKNQTTLTWKGVSATVKDKAILQNCWGYCLPGEMLAIMGPSGAGKTTLLSILAAKKSSAVKVQGQVRANRQTYTEQNFYKFASFVFQNDILFETLTVKETLQFAARMKIANKESAQERVKQLIQQFELQKCSDVYIGGRIVKGISGGQKKRVCIAVQMTSKPSVLILDQPTSGLDSHMAVEVLKILKKLSIQGKSIIFTIHQPSGYMYSELDRIILLDKGKTIYQGRTDQVQRYLGDLGVIVPEKTTMSDFFMMEISAFKAKRFGYQTPFSSRTYEEKQMAFVDQKVREIEANAPKGYSKVTTALPLINQFTILIQRQAKIFVRNRMRGAKLYISAIINLIIVGLIFLGSIRDNLPPVEPPFPTRAEIGFMFIGFQGSCFVIITSIMMNSMFSVILVFPTQKVVFSKQSASRTYNTLPYFLSKVLIEIPNLILSMLIFSIGIFFMMGFTPEITIITKFCLIIISLSMFGNSFGLLLGSMIADAHRAVAFAPALFLPLMMFSGLYNKLHDIPGWIAWIQYFSPFKYGLHMMLANQFGDRLYWTSDRGFYDYRDDLGIDMDFFQGLGIVFGLAVMGYTTAFFFLRQFKASIAA